MELIAQGAHNINLVTPTHFLPKILPALEPKLPVPVVYNCGGYERVEMLRLLEGKVDIYLPDLKFAEPGLAKALCGAENYFPVAAHAIDEMLRQVGPPVYGPDGMLKKGVVIRHLVLPGQVQNSLKVLDYIADHFPRGSVLVSLMAQFVPSGRLKNTPPFGNYDCCIIDNAPDLGMNVINALVAADEIIIPVNLDCYSLDGLEELVDQVNNVRQLNRKAHIAGVLITDYEKSDTSEAAETWLREKSGLIVFNTIIRHSKKVKDSTFYHKTPIAYSVRSGAAQGYKNFILECMGETRIAEMQKERE